MCIRAETKRNRRSKAGNSGYRFATLAHETRGRVGEEAKEQIRMLADEACSNRLGIDQHSVET